MPATYADFFAPDYAHARELFLDAARARKCRLQQIEHPDLRDPLGHSIGVDVAALGPDDADRLLLIVSATHGIEGFLGSALQCGLLRDHSLYPLPRGMRVVLVHAINPHGFAYERRVNEDNIDLNRNFLAHDDTAPQPSGYELLHRTLMTWDGSSRLQEEPEIIALIRDRGAARFQSALTSGQRTHADGLFFAGRQACWSNRSWRQILKTHGTGASRIVAIDLHTGLGERGECEPILFSGDARQASQTFGRELTLLAASGSSASSSIAGTLLGAVGQELNANIIAAALEIGTVPLMEMLDTLRAEHVVRHHGTPGPLSSEVRLRMQETFCPSDANWRRSATLTLREYIARAIASLAS